MRIRQFVVLTTALVALTLLSNSSSLAATEPNDSKFPDQVYLQQIRAPQAWDLTTGSGDVTVAVLSSGIRLSVETTLKLWENSDEIPWNMIDDDGNGYIDDTWGWNFVDGNNMTDDHVKAGTAYAGIIGAETDNIAGIAGVSWGARIMDLKVVSDENLVYVDRIPEALQYALDNGSRVILIPFSFLSLDLEVAEAIAGAHRQGALVIAPVGDVPTKIAAAAGAASSPRLASPTGDGKQVQVADPCRLPACLREVIAVAGTTKADEHWGNSLVHERVDLSAPAERIIHIDASDLFEIGYGRSSTTMLAAPQVAGVANLVWSVDPTLTNVEVEQILMDTAVDLGDPGWDEQFGWGRIDAYAAVRAAWDRRYPFHTYFPFVGDAS